MCDNREIFTRRAVPWPTFAPRVYACVQQWYSQSQSKCDRMKTRFYENSFSPHSRTEQLNEKKIDFIILMNYYYNLYDIFIPQNLRNRSIPLLIQAVAQVIFDGWPWSKHALPMRFHLSHQFNNRIIMYTRNWKSVRNSFFIVDDENRFPRYKFAWINT